MSVRLLSAFISFRVKCANLLFSSLNTLFAPLMLTNGFNDDDAKSLTKVAGGRG